MMFYDMKLYKCICKGKEKSKKDNEFLFKKKNILDLFTEIKIHIILDQNISTYLNINEYELYILVDLVY